ncbi:asparagine synthase (glutamine-hydrolyzing) [Hoeflea sp. YIM 152468]|uniref:asparagine synthase (glutamine-hydrolyzing) n=1 Tax=Hoeflea sp. YIM 152468 TaxID=3031759 RepID=UPI0023DCCBD8|nr:asparagine synthase (glutamine-hydrolyzing) [Hoeflea sp. YIM 152468]MDF1610263.1 asparagine synthase (glutamine-hydrolyzing) [Hoeflea sp. YIM 152468]
MCGLYASIGIAPDPARIDLVAHRGPDGRGWAVHPSPCGPVSLGHRRLAIIDTSDAGLQPMSDTSGRYQLIFNGEIYNYLELRERLIAQGEVFLTRTDSEVLLRAYVAWGAKCLDELRGMFAFVIWDARDKKMFAARDRFGIKPLYLAQTPSGLAFASEIKQLAGLDSLAGRMNVARVHDFLASGITDHTSETLFDGIEQLRGGECISVDASGGRLLTARRRWYPVPANRIQLSLKEAAEKFHDLLSDAVRLHLRSDVPVGSCLSGGLDSSSIVCLMAGMMPDGHHVNTVSACYAEKSVDEKPFMDVAVRASGSIPHFVFPKPQDVFQTASDITWHQDEPFGSTSVFAQWCVFAEAKKLGIKVMLDGQGADEQLAGYHTGFAHYLAGLIKSGRLLKAGQTIAQRRDLHGTSAAAQLMRLAPQLLPAMLAGPLRKRYQRMTKGNWLETELIAMHGNPSGALASSAQHAGLGEPHDIASLCEVMTFGSNLQMLLHWEDRNSMAHSIEARVPFLDHPLVEFSLALGNEHKFDGAETKKVLRAGMANVLPGEIVNRHDKLGFATPEQAWFRGPLKGDIIDGVEATLRRFPDLLDAKATRRLRDHMLEGSMPVDFTLWRIVNLGIWGERFGVS